MLYAIECKEYQCFKFGYTKTKETLETRIKTLQTGCPKPLSVFGVCEGTLKEEKRLQNMCVPFRSNGEWFSYDGKHRRLVLMAGLLIKGMPRAANVLQALYTMEKYLKWQGERYSVSDVSDISGSQFRVYMECLKKNLDTKNIIPPKDAFSSFKFALGGA